MRPRASPPGTRRTRGTTSRCGTRGGSGAGSPPPRRRSCPGSPGRARTVSWLHEAEIVDVPDAAGLAVAVHHHLHRVTARLELHAGLRHRLEDLPAARVDHLDGAGPVDAVELEVEGPALLVRRDLHFDRVGARLAHVDGPDEPLAFA